MNSIESTLLLNMVPAIGPIRFKNLQNYYGDLSYVFSASMDELKSVETISETIARSILSFKNQQNLIDKELQLAETHKISILTIDHAGYPPLLKTIADPPPVLYCKGDTKIFEKPAIALVGSRRPTPYGERVAATLSRDLATAGITTVSGLARGIDSVVHRTTVQLKGKTIAVLGSGLLKVYPPENKKLAEDITEDGAVLSEFPLTIPPDPGHFPRRNRIIAGLALGTVVIEADEKSGALITARLAADQGRDIFAVPGPITSKMSRGPHRLIREGAKLVEKVEDIFEEITFLKENGFTQLSPARTPPENNQTPSLSAAEKDLLNFIQLDPIHIDSISYQSRLASGQLSQILLNLEMKGIVRSLPGKMYARV